MSTKDPRIELLQGTLDLLILRTLLLAPLHGHALAKTIEIQVEIDVLYPEIEQDIIIIERPSDT